MRTIVDLPEDQIAALDRIRARLGVSRAELIRRAVSAYSKQHEATAGEEAFGLWNGRRVSALDYEDRLRDEWEPE